MILVLIANSNTCKMYHYIKHPVKLSLLKEINHPENKMHNRDLTSDRPGHYQGGISSRGAYEPHMDTKKTKIDDFTREIATELNSERNKNDYQKLILIAPSQVVGLIFQHLDKHVKDLITNDIQKDIVHLSDKELIEFLRTNANFPQ